MTIRPLLIVASVAALCACNQAATTNNSSAAAPAAPTASGTPAPAPATPGPAAPAAPADPQLAAQLQAAAQMASARLPMQQQTPAGAITLESMVARGNELITTMTVPQDLDQATFGVQFGQQLPRQACGNAAMAQMIRRGAVITYNVKDSAGEEFTASVSSC